MKSAPSTLSILDLGPHLFGFYDGRIPGARYFSGEPNWVDDGGFALGICSYAVVNGRSALVYDTHLSIEHARSIRDALESRGVSDIRVVLSHWHLDHVAGNAVFSDCEIIANDKTMRLLTQNKAAIESGALDGAPPINPLVLPTTMFQGDLTLEVEGLAVELHSLDIHSRDGLALYLPHDGTLLAGDTLEDTVTYVDEPGRLEDHLIDLARLETWEFTRILPNHGAKEVIAGSGYGRPLIHATRNYVEKLMRTAAEDIDQHLDLRKFLAGPIADGWVNYFAPYDEVHRCNLTKVRALQTSS